MKKEQVIELYKMIMPNENAESFVEQIFQNYDDDNNGYLDFQVHSLTIQCVSPLSYLYNIFRSF